MASNPMFRPAQALLNRLTLPGKIMLMGAGFMVIIALLAGLYFKAQVEAVQSTQLERSGVTAIAPTVDVIRMLQRHRGLRSRLLNGDSKAQAAVDEARRNADAAVAKADQQLAGLLAPFGLASDWQQISGGWKNLRAAGNRAAAQDFAEHSALVAKTMALISRIADESALTLDPEIDTYYLMDAAVFRLPTMIEDSARSRGLAAGIAARSAIQQDERIALAVLNASYRQNLAALDDGLKKVAAVNAELTTGISAEREKAVKAGQAFETLIQARFVASATISEDSVQTFAAGTRAVDSAFDLWQTALGKLDAGLVARAERQTAEASLVAGVGIALLAVVVYLFAALRQVVATAASQIAATADKITAGDLNSTLSIDSRDEFGHIAATLDGMRKSLSAQLERERVVAVENLRIRNALDRASVNLMLADADGRIIYMNDSVSAMLRAAEGEIRKRLGSFSVDGLIGRNFDDFHRNPAHQRGILANLSGTHASQIEVGPYKFLLKASPVIDKSGKRLGTVLEWNDRTAEVAVEAELAGLVEAAVAGDFDHRIELKGKQGFFRQLAEGMNNLTGVVAGAIDDVGTVLNAVARGDLTRRIETEYSGSLGQLKSDANATVDKLREVVSGIQLSSDAINVAAREISAGNADLSSRTEEQASSLEQTASSMEQLNATVRQNAENARQANELAHSSNSVAEHGGDMMGRVVANMASIQESSHKIADIIGVIDSIAFQTNILALNAAVEAARAGEQGRGFAVVATEVRSLAQRSAQAAKEIKGLIDDSVGKVEDGASLVDDAGKTMAEIVTNFKQLASLVTEIANASREQSSGIEQVTQAVGQMDEVTQQNAALVEEAAAAAESLQDQAGALVQAVGMFQLDAGARPSAMAPARGIGGSRAPSVAAVASKPAAKSIAAPLPKVKRGSHGSAAVQDEWEEF